MFKNKYTYVEEEIKLNIGNNFEYIKNSMYQNFWNAAKMFIEWNLYQHMYILEKRKFKTPQELEQ